MNPVNVRRPRINLLLIAAFVDEHSYFAAVFKYTDYYFMFCYFRISKKYHVTV